jgi:hypothetical protein
VRSAFAGFSDDLSFFGGPDDVIIILTKMDSWEKMSWLIGNRPERIKGFSKHMKSLKFTMAFTVMVALMLTVKLVAGENASDNQIFAKLSSVTSAELPAAAAELIKQSAAEDLKLTTIAVVKAAVGLNPAAAPVIVGSIAQSTPEMSGIAAATAVALVPNQMVAIAQAAAAAAPSKAGLIVEAICRVLPANYRTVAETVANIVPGADKEILAGIVAAIPELQGNINQALATYNGKMPSLNAVLSQAAQIQSASGTLALSAGTRLGVSAGSPVGTPVIPVTSLPQGPSPAPPQVPISTTPPVINPSSGTTAPGGGHDYTSP